MTLQNTKTLILNVCYSTFYWKKGFFNNETKLMNIKDSFISWMMFMHGKKVNKFII